MIIIVIYLMVVIFTYNINMSLTKAPDFSVACALIWPVEIIMIIHMMLKKKGRR